MAANERVTPVDFGAIGKKLQSAEVLSEDERYWVFSRATNFASDIIDEKLKAVQYTPMGVDVRSHLTVIVLDRIVSQYQSGSTKLFDHLKEAICESFAIKDNNLSDERMYTVLGLSLDSYFSHEISDEVRKNMNFIRASVEKIVVNN